MVDQAWSVRQTSQDIVISQDKQTEGYRLKKGAYVTIPHDLHMMDPAYFSDPEKFDPERFLVEQEDGTLKAEIGTARPYGGGKLALQILFLFNSYLFLYRAINV